MTFKKVIANGYSCGLQIVVFFVSTHQTVRRFYSQTRKCARAQDLSFDF